MLAFIQIAILTGFGCIAYQDIKDKEVSVILFFLVAISTGIYHYNQSPLEVFGIHLLMNISLVSIVLLVLYTYIRLRQNHIFFNVFGSGDMAMFYALCFSFATVSFIVSFVSSICFSLVLSVMAYERTAEIPLAGHMAIFFLCVTLANWVGIIDNVYLI